MILGLLLACGSRAGADAAPPLSTPEPAEDLGTLAESVEAAAPATEEPVIVERVEPVIVERPETVVDLTGLGVVMVDPVLLDKSGFTQAEVAAIEMIVSVVAEEVASRRPPGMGVPWYERYADELALLLLALLAALVRRVDLRQIGAQMRSSHDLEPLPPDEARQALASQLAAAEARHAREIAARDRKIAILEEAERRATQRERERERAAASAPITRLDDQKLVESLEARGRAALAAG